MPLRCGALSNVDDTAGAIRTTRDGRRRQGSTSNLNKRTRRPRTESAFRSMLISGSTAGGGGRNDRDPLSLVGSEFFLRPTSAGGENYNNNHRQNHHHHHHHHDHALEALERRKDDYKSPRHSPRYCPAGRHRGEMMHDDRQHPPSSNQRLQPTGGGGRGVVTTAGGGRNRYGLAVSTSSSTESECAPNFNDGSCRSSLQQRRLRREVLRSIHGKYRDRPSCPNCHGELTYIYASSALKRRHGKDDDDDGDGDGDRLSSEPPRVSAIEIHVGNESARYKLRRLLPPVCEKCRTHLLFEGTEMKYLMMENFNSWIDGCRRESDSEDDDGYHDDDTCNDRHHGGGKGAHGNNAVTSYDYNDPRNAKIVIVGCTPTPLHPDETLPTPRRNNSCHGDRGSFFRECDANDDRERMLTDDQNSTFSIGTNKPYRRKGELDYEQNINVMTGDDVEREQRKQHWAHDEERQDEATEAGDEDATRVFDGKYFSFDEDPFASDDSGNGREGIQLIRTASEERMILEHYSMKREIATKEIAKDLLRGNELLTYKCERCNMPMTQNRVANAPIECVTCLGVKRKAKRIAKQKRKETEMPPETEILSSDATQLAADAFITIHETVSIGHTPGKDSESMTDLNATRNANRLVEGQMGFISSAPNCPDRLETISYDNRSSSSSIGLNALHDERRPKESAIAQQSEVGHATSFQSYTSSSQDRHPEVEYSLSSYKSNIHQHSQSKLLQSFSGQSEGLSSEVSMCNVSSEVSSTRCPRNLSSSEQLYHCRGGELYQGCISEVSEPRHSSIMSHSPLFKGVPPCEMIQQGHEQTTISKDGRVSDGESNPQSSPVREAILEVENSSRSPSDEPFEQRPQSNSVREAILDVANSSRSPSDVPFGQRPQSNPVREAILDVANSSRSPSDVPFAQRPHVVPIDALNQKPDSMGESDVRHIDQDSTTGLSECRSSSSAAKCQDICSVSYPKIAPSQKQQNAVDVYDGLPCQILDAQNQINCSASSEISPTRCPRDLPSCEMTWQYDKHDEKILRSRGSDHMEDSSREVPDKPSLKDDRSVNYNSELVHNGQSTSSNSLKRRSGSETIADLPHEVSDQPPLNDDRIVNYNSELVENEQPKKSNSLVRRSGGDEDSISKGINRLANSLREVADQLPQNNFFFAPADSDLVENSRQIGSNSLDRKCCKSPPVYPSQHISKQKAFHDVEESSEQGLHVNNISCHKNTTSISWGGVYPIQSPTVKKNDSKRKFIHSSSPGILHAKIPHSVAMSNSVQIPITLWSKQQNMFSPIAAVEESKHVHFFRNDRGISTAQEQHETRPEALHLNDHSKPSISRVDPPGCKIDYCEKEGRDPPDEASLHSMIINRRDSHNSEIVIGAVEKSPADSEWATPRNTNIQAKPGIDAPSEIFVSDRTQRNRSMRKSITSEIKWKKTHVGNNRPSSPSTISTNPSPLSIGGRNHSSHSSDSRGNRTKRHPCSQRLQVSCELNSSVRDSPTEKFEHYPLFSSHSILMSVTPKTKGNNSYTGTSYHFDKGRTCTETHPTLKRSQGQVSSLDGLSWDSDEIDASLQTAKSWGDSSMDLLFKRIDEIQDDFISVVTSLPSSDGQSLLSLRSENDSLKSIKNKHSLIEIFVNKSRSFESDASSGSSMITDAVERMRNIKAYIDKIESVDDGSDSDGCNSQDEMSELIQRLASAADALRELNDWED